VVKPDSGESAAYRGMRKGASPLLPFTPGCGRTSATAIAESMAEQNHFSPWMRHEPSAAGWPVVVARPTSDPPWDSVIHCPLVMATAGSVAIRRGNQASRRLESTSERESRAAAPSAIATGHVNVADSGPYR
jgi:hypothetical protein